MASVRIPLGGSREATPAWASLQPTRGHLAPALTWVGFGKAGPSAGVKNSWMGCGTESEKKPWAANHGLLLLGKASVH